MLQISSKRLYIKPDSVERRRLYALTYMSVHCGKTSHVDTTAFPPVYLIALMHVAMTTSVK